MDGHLVAVEVGVVSGANQRMNTNGLALDKNRLEGLDGEAMERRSAVQEDRMALGDFLQNVPDLGRLALDHLFGGADGVNIAQLLQAPDDERLEEHERHFLGQPALVQFQFRPDDNDGTAGVIDAFAQEILAEAPALALKHVAERFQGAISGPGDSAAMTTVVK